MNYELIATLGPASTEALVWRAMVDCGVTAFRLNTSHLSLEGLVTWLERLESSGVGLPLVLDLQGSKWRLGQFSTFELVSGQVVELVAAEDTHKALTLPVPHADFFRAVEQSNGEIVLNDAKSRLQVVETRGGDWLRARVTLGGKISAHKGVTLAACEARIETLSRKDEEILRLAAGRADTRFAISYVRDAQEMARYHQLCGPDAHLIAKLERQPAMEQAAQIAQFTEALWVCRGDLGAELGLAGMARAVNRFAGQVAGIPRPVILAGQVLEHMTVSETPTRSEVCCMYDALKQGYAGFVLSDETAVGRNPVESCRAAALFRGE